MNQSPSAGAPVMRAVIYARYSSDQQSDASIDDQVRLCKERIAKEGWVLTQVFRDAAISGATTLRPGYQALLAGGREAAFDVVVTEALDRLSRDQEDVAALFKRLSFAGIHIVTLAEGEISELHVGLKGTMNALFLKDLAAKTHRGLRGRVEAGQSAGGRAFGYDVVRQSDADGEPIRGKRTVDAAEAATVRRIFSMFAAGQSPLAIAHELNSKKVPGPDGRPWRDTTIRGHGLRGTGILRNELYVGRRVWNRMRYIKDPATGRRVSRMNPPDQLVAEDVPALRILDQDVWDQAQARLSAIRARSGADAPDRPKFWEHRRPHTILTGKIFCACCGGTMANVGQDYLACGTARKQGLCVNRKGIRRPDLEALILDALRTRLMAPELAAEFITAFTIEWNRFIAERSAERGTHERELATVVRQLDNLIDAVANGMRGSRLQTQMDGLEARKAALEAVLAAPIPTAPRLHPNLAQVYREKVTALQAALTSADESAAALVSVRELIERIEVQPAADGKGLEIELTGEIASMVRLGLSGDAAARRALLSGGGDHGLFASSVKVVAGAGNHRQLTLPPVVC